MDLHLEKQADILIQKIKHYLMTTMGRTSDEADSTEFYRAFCYAFREEIMINWSATARTLQQKDTRQLYYFSMEYLPGRLTYNNIININSLEIVQAVIKRMNRDFNEILSREFDPGLGNGGLGRLASCFLDSLATLQLPAQAYGLRYQYGIFEQQLWNGLQVERPDVWLINENPWEFRRDLRKVFIKYCGSTKALNNAIEEEIFELLDFEEVCAVPYDLPIIGYSKDRNFSVVTLRLWSTKESPSNFQLQRYNAGRLDQAAENTTLTDVLYPSDNHDTGKRIRLKQEFLLVSASLQDILRHYLSNHSNLNAFQDKVRIQINDTHPALVIAELMRLLTKNHGLPWKKAWEITQACTSYTNHTILSEALEQWDYNLFHYLLPRQTKIIEKINHDFCNTIREKYPNNEEKVRHLSIIENGQVRMAHLAIHGSHHVNGVAALHTEILKHSVFKDFYDLWPEKFINVTNGVTPRRWLLHCNPELASFITERIGDAWITQFTAIKELARYASDQESQEQFLAIKKRNKSRLIDYIQRELKLRDFRGNLLNSTYQLSNEALFDVQIKRIHEYKRQLLNALHLIMMYHEIIDNPNPQRIPRVVIFSGKAAASYETAKTIIRLIHCIGKKINKDPVANAYLRVIFIENYNVSKAELIIPAADLSEQISTAGMEASGTGNMKLAINGALTIGTNDGANIEMRHDITDMWWPFSFGASAEEILEMRNKYSYNAWDIYSMNPQIRRAIDALKDRSLISEDSEHQSLSALYYKLLEGNYGSMPDKYFILKDLESYYQMQKTVEILYKHPLRWAEFAIHNIAGMGNFSTDTSIQNYCSKIWGINSCPIDPQIFDIVRNEYSEHSKRAF